MLLKLSLTGIKSRLKDYVVLFSGLTISSAIFYMFLSLAMNNDFLSKNSLMSAANTTIVFGFGVVLLALITLVYLIYANTFLLSMRQRDYGMYMMLGARSGKIGLLIFLETMILGTLASALGIFLGVGLTQVTANLLVTQLNLSITGFVGFYVPAVFATLIFFVVLFFIAALTNRKKLASTPVLELLRGNQKPVKYRKNAGLVIGQAIGGVLLLAVGYWAMFHFMQLQLMSIPVALFTIVLGSYFVFNSFFITVINIIRKNHKVLYKGLRSFTLNQLRFRITDYTKILSIISIMFAMALGAITVGLGFEKMSGELTKNQTYYDVQILDETPAVKNEVKKLSVKDQTKYSFKMDDKNIYAKKSEIEKNPVGATEGYQTKDGDYASRPTTYTLDQVSQQNTKYDYAMNSIFPNENGSRKINYLSDEEFDQIKAKPQSVTLIRVNDFQKDAKVATEIVNLQVKNNKALQPYMELTKPMRYQLVHSLTSGFEFMGFFLGIAFLTMLASTLMFKILSGAQSDIVRYQMLNKIGVRRKVLKKSIGTEIGVLFALPGILGIFHVLFGLQFFKAFMHNPYDGIWIPFTIFIVLYTIYYFITKWLYQSIVLKDI